MELKEYQQGVLNKLDRYLNVLSEHREQAEEFVEFRKSKGRKAILSDFCREAWDQLNSERMLPTLNQGGSSVVAPYISRLDGLMVIPVQTDPPFRGKLTPCSGAK